MTLVTVACLLLYFLDFLHYAFLYIHYVYLFTSNQLIPFLIHFFPLCNSFITYIFIVATHAIPVTFICLFHLSSTLFHRNIHTSYAVFCNFHYCFFFPLARVKRQVFSYYLLLFIFSFILLFYILTSLVQNYSLPPHH